MQPNIHTHCLWQCTEWAQPDLSLPQTDHDTENHTENHTENNTAHHASEDNAQHRCPPRGSVRPGRGQTGRSQAAPSFLQDRVVGLLVFTPHPNPHVFYSVFGGEATQLKEIVFSVCRLTGIPCTTVNMVIAIQIKSLDQYQVGYSHYESVCNSIWGLVRWKVKKYIVWHERAAVLRK